MFRNVPIQSASSSTRGMGHAENCNAEIVRSIRVLPVRILHSIPPVIQDLTLTLKATKWLLLWITSNMFTARV